MEKEENVTRLTVINLKVNIRYLTDVSMHARLHTQIYIFVYVFGTFHF